jgi:hypothetical protein
MDQTYLYMITRLCRAQNAVTVKRVVSPTANSPKSIKNVVVLFLGPIANYATLCPKLILAIRDGELSLTYGPLLTVPCVVLYTVRLVLNRVQTPHT